MHVFHIRQLHVFALYIRSKGGEIDQAQAQLALTMIKQPSVSLAPNTSCQPQHALARAAAGSARSRRISCLHLAVLHVGRHHARALCSNESAFSGANNNTNHDVKLRSMHLCCSTFWVPFCLASCCN
jgi:hypothetical protein